MESAFGAEAEAAVGFALQGGEVVEEWRGLGGGFAFFADRAGFALALGLDFIRAGAVPEAFGLGVFVVGFFVVFVFAFVFCFVAAFVV